MGLINLQTNLKSLRYGKDRVYGGDSGQPYIQKDIPEQVGEFGFLNQDFILRGGSKAVTDSALDVERLGKYFLDIRNPSGLLFVAKQNLLSRTAVRTQASTGLLNEGVYTPLSTLIEAGGVAFGLHVNKQGLNPFDGPGSITKYIDIVTLTNTNIAETTTTTSTTSIENGIIREDRNFIEAGPFLVTNFTTVENRRNRLVGLWNDKIIINNQDINVLSYKGGPGSNLGIGTTNIKFATGNGVNDSRTGVNNFNNIKSSGFRNSNEIINQIQNPEGASLLYNKYFVVNKTGIVNNQLVNSSFKSSISGSGTNNYFTIGGGGLGVVGGIQGYDSPTLERDNGPYGTRTNENDNSSITYVQTDFNNEIGYKTNNYTIQDFREILRKRINESSVTPGSPDNPWNIISSSPPYSGSEAKNIELRVKLGDPGNPTGKNLKSYTSGIGEKYHGAASETSFDKITYRPLYQSENPDFGKDTNNDLVKFAIGVMNLPTDSGASIQKTYIHFRAFLNQITDNFVSEWDGVRYIGRGEKLYNYIGFDRKFSLSWTVAAQSKVELISMYKKLNYLASVCAPDYSDKGYMRGNIITLSVGGYFYDQTGIITGFNYEMNDDQATWEIGINDKGDYDSSVKELPHLIKVTGFQFIPIHTFVPRKQSLNINGIKNSDSFNLDVALYGKERYIHLSNGMPDSWDKNNNNYGNIYDPTK